jgi:hypothetical protein
MNHSHPKVDIDFKQIMIYSNIGLLFVMQVFFANVPSLVVLLKVETITIDNIEVITCMKITNIKYFLNRKKSKQIMTKQGLNLNPNT